MKSMPSMKTMIYVSYDLDSMLPNKTTHTHTITCDNYGQTYYIRVETNLKLTRA